jgi:vitamin B12 transporter
MKSIAILRWIILCSLVAWLLVPFSVFATTSGIDTLIHLPAVEFHAARLPHAQAGFNYHETDSLDRLKHSFSGLDKLLARQAGVFVRSYGPGILATTSVRGGSASQTALLWQGVPLENPMNAQNDLSLLPVFFFDDISMQYGGSSARWGSGALAGAIFLESSGPRQQGFSLGGGLEATSLEGFSQQVRANYADQRLRTSIRAFNHHSANKYQYTNTALPTSPRQTQQYAGTSGSGVLGEVQVRIGSRHAAGLNLWMQSDLRNIPPALYQMHSGAQQQDRATRLTASWESDIGPARIIWRGAWFDEALTYRDSLNLESHSQWQTLQQEAGAAWQASQTLVLHAGIRHRQVKAGADNYEGLAQRDLLAFYASASWATPDDKVQVRAEGRQEVGGGLQIPFMPAVGVAYQIGRGFMAKANAGKNFRLPSLNDLYWSPGGNPDLRPERGWSQDAGIFWESPSGSRSASVTGFHRLISDWISWLPGSGGLIWRPVNIMQVRSYGLEARISGEARGFDVAGLPGLTFSWQAGWDHSISKNLKGTSPNDRSAGKQLVYVPRNKGQVSLGMEAGAFRLEYDHTLTGKSYTSSDNLQWIPAWQQGDLMLGGTTKIYGQQTFLFLQVVNLWNQAFEMMPARPMPLRFFKAGFQLKLQTLQTKQSK